MSTFVLVPGAGGSAWYWHLVTRDLTGLGHEAIAVGLPGADESAGLPEYADAVTAAIGDRRDVVVVGQSMGAFTAPVACSRVPARLLVLVNPMIPWPGETPGEWWEHTGWAAARVAAAEAGGYPVDFDLASYFLHDVPADVIAEGEAHDQPEASVAFGQPCAIGRWPDVPTRVVAGRDDRFFPLDFQRRVARERLGAAVDVVPGGHLAALARPAELTGQLIAYL